MTVIALAISVEELARELPAAMKSHPEISVGNMARSVLAFFLFNAGVIALVRPLEVDAATVRFYLPVAARHDRADLGVPALRRLPRWASSPTLPQRD